MGEKVSVEMFRDFWINCRTNNILTLLCSKEKSIRKMAAMNDYIYHVDGRNEYYRALSVYRGIRFESAIHIDTKKYVFKTEDYVKELKNCIDKGIFVCVQVDLYFWKKNAYQYGKEHSYHFSMAVGYSEQENLLYFDDADIEEGYLEITPEHFKESVVIEDNQPKAFVYEIPEEVEPYEINIEEVVHNTNMLLKSLEDMQCISHWSTFGDYKKTSIMIFFCQVLNQRQRANKCLFRYLFEDHLLEEEPYQVLTQKAEDLKIAWENLKSIFLKEDLRKKPFDMLHINQLSIHNLQSEREMWLYFLKAVGGKYQSEDYTGDGFWCVPDYTEYEQENVKGEIFLSEMKVIPVCRENGRPVTDILLKYSNVQGSLKNMCEGIPYVVESYSYRSYEFLPDFIENIIINKNEVTLKTNVPYRDINGIETFMLSYRSDRGGIVDSSGRSLPELLFMRLENDKNITPFINRYKRSTIYAMNSSLEELPYQEIAEANFTPVVEDHYYCTAPVEFETLRNPAVVYFKYNFWSDRQMNLTLFLGCSGDVKVWINRKQNFCIPKNDTSALEIERKEMISFQAGENEIMVAVVSNCKASEGISIRLQNEQECQLPKYILEL